MLVDCLTLSQGPAIGTMYATNEAPAMPTCVIWINLCSCPNNILMGSLICRSRSGDMLTPTIVIDHVTSHELMIDTL